MGDQTIKCNEKVYPREQYGCFHGYKCGKSVWKDGKCKIHHPETVKKRKEESEKRYEEKKKLNERREIEHAICLLQKNGYTVIKAVN